jgi:biotin-dependent carboxylase-like uncharacterized protein
MITLLKAPPFATVQDLGRYGYRGSAVPPSGAMDPAALARANLAAGNPPAAAAIEWGIGAGRVTLSPGLTVALAGADAVARREGDVLAIEELRSGAWLYLAVGGGVDVPEVLGSRSTFLPGRFGGLEGRLLQSGDVLGGGGGGGGGPGGGEEPPPPIDVRRAIEIVPGPERAMLTTEVWNQFLAADWTVSRAVSRAGYRLDGPALPLDLPDDLPSAPVCPGTIQLPPGGRPIVLMPDGPTVGGYPRIAVILREALGRLAQRRPGESLRFALG